MYIHAVIRAYIQILTTAVKKGGYDIDDLREYLDPPCNIAQVRMLNVMRDIVLSMVDDPNPFAI